MIRSFLEIQTISDCSSCRHGYMFRTFGHQAVACRLLENRPTAEAESVVALMQTEIPQDCPRLREQIIAENNHASLRGFPVPVSLIDGKLELTELSSGSADGKNYTAYTPPSRGSVFLRYEAADFYLVIPPVLLHAAADAYVAAQKPTFFGADFGKPAQFTDPQPYPTGGNAAEVMEP